MCKAVDSQPTEKMKLTLVVLAVISWTTTLGQLRSTYTIKGVAAGTAGRERFTQHIILNSDSSFLWVSKSYNYRKRTLISSYTTKGKWTTDNQVLKLKHSPETTGQDGEYDIYTIKKKRLKRTTIKGKWTNYKGSRELLKMTGTVDANAH